MPLAAVSVTVDIILGLLYNGLTVFQIYVKMLKMLKEAQGCIKI